ncbi:MAG: hypothetical protein DMG23_10380 [Acidobacteria bacterium]|nr:MAG: hypothetical protein DMG23_10380 [Acidobacteriota bacterium]
MALLPAVAAAQGTLWDQYNDKGNEAYRQRHYTEAEKLFLVALNEAKRFGPLEPLTSPEGSLCN